VDVETIITFKKLLSQLGINNFYLEQTNSLIHNQTNTNFDFRSSYLASDIDIENQNCDMLLLIGTNPRYEASTFNIRLRQLIMKKKNLGIDVLTLGSPFNLTYKTTQMSASGGNTLESLYLLNQGKTKTTIKLLNALKPLCILSHYITERPDGKAIRFMLENILFYFERARNKVNKGIFKEENKTKQQAYRKLHTISKKNKQITLFDLYTNFFSSITKVTETDFRGSTIGNESGVYGGKGGNGSEANFINILHTHASFPGAFDLGFASTKKKEIKDLNLIYLLGADIDDDLDMSTSNELKNTQKFIIYQGHHGCKAASLADIVLPSTTYVEKKGTYVNTQGYVQQAQLVLNSDFDIYPD
jgi:NADH dehydrogenase/NADH:ubiquinone oxidoreductase subunit G